MNNCLKRIFMCSLLALSGCDELSAEPTKPNIIILYVDDLGYGDIGINGATGVRTPNIDQLAAEGLNFTDAHSTAATCTPSRYALLTGEHGFRINSDILEGDAPALIEPGRPTLPRMLNNAGYNTAVIGKWHLGFGNGNIDWNGKVAPGPLELGFDYSFNRLGLKSKFFTGERTSDEIDPIDGDSGNGWTTVNYALFGEGLFRLRSNSSMLLGARLDAHRYTNLLFSPRIAFIQNLTSIDTLKIMGSISHRRSSESNLRQSINRNKPVENEQIKNFNYYSFTLFMICNSVNFASLRLFFSTQRRKVRRVRKENYF